MSHEIRTPLTAIIGMAALLSESTLSPAQRESAEIIRTGGETLLNLIGDILDFSKIDAGQIELAIQPFDLPTICQAAIDLVSQAATRKGLALSWQIGPDVPTIVIGDSGRLRQVLVNLLANAVKFTERGEVVLRVEPRALRDEPQSERATLVFAVRDTGIGIAPDQLDQIFKPFVQADQVLARQTSGTGLGLAISHQLAELMGGQLVVVSAIGVGTTFSLILPLGIAATGPAVPQVAALLTSVAALQVLIAEDNAINQEVLRRMLEQIGATPTVVSDGAAALAAVRAAPFDLVLMDIQMPVLDGEAATQRIRALGAEITQPRIIALTASALRGDRERYLRAGMDDYLSKPVQLDDLRRVLVPLANMDEAAAPTRREGPQAAGAGVQAAHVDWQIIAQMLSSLKMPQGQATALVRDLYERELPTQLAALTAAALAEDRALVARLAHKLCGGSQQLGAQAMAAACTVLESAAQNLGRPALGDQIAQINQIYTETWALIQAHLTALA
jgi:CheY-like chemotaxis protein